MDDLTLAAEFPSPTRDDWLTRIAAVLKGADFEKKLVARSYDGLRIEPLYDKAEAPPQPGRAVHGRWRIAQRIDHPEPASANELALADLEGGADALAFVYAGAPSARGFGVRIETADDLDRALEGVMLDLIHIRLETAPFRGRFAAAQWSELIRRRGLDPAALSIDVGLDPIGDLARTESLPEPWPTLAGRISDLTRELREAGFAGSTLRVDARAYHEAGASEAQELAAAVATGVAYLRALEAGGHALEAARDALAFLLVADADEFLTVAKLRALRRLWARVEAACGLVPKPARLEAETAWRMTTRRDPWVNLLRATIAAFSAGIGGADAVTVLPFTAALGLPDAFARRLARNTQLILLEESNLWRVEDPAAGAGGFESLTEALCEAAWTLFQEIERDGGMVESLIAGRLQACIARVRGEREAAIATRRAPITGTSEFSHLGEAEVQVLMPLPDQAQGAASLPSTRLAEPFERLRDGSDAVLARTGARPRVFLANLGPIAAFTPRATFAKNFFEAGGVEAVANEGFSSADALAQAFRGSGADVACLCSSDAVYAVEGEGAARALREAGCTRLTLAGRPGELEARLREAGVAEFIFAGCNALAILETLVEAQP